MWLLYLLAVVLGGGILLIQLFSGHGHHVDLHDMDAGEHPHEGPGFISLRSASFALFGFGLVGGCLQVLGLTAPWLALLFGLASGAAAMLGVGWTFRSLADPSVSGEAALHEAKGRRARVLMACTAEQRGKVRVSLKGQQVDMMALSSGAEIPEGTEVVIVEVRDEVAQVVTTDELGPWVGETRVEEGK
jgi:membrane protein implicated in regulation of membrane protease activity